MSDAFNADTLIAAATGAANSDPFTVPENGHFTFFCDALASGETVTLQVQKPDGSWLDTTVTLTDASNIDCIYGKGQYRLAKSVTAGAVGVYAFGISFIRRGK